MYTGRCPTYALLVQAREPALVRLPFSLHQILSTDGRALPPLSVLIMGVGRPCMREEGEIEVSLSSDPNT
jgi:hypothetical protein